MISWDELSHQWTKIWIGTGYSPINYLNQCWLIVNWATSIGRNIKGIWIKLLNCYFDEKHQVPFIDLNIFLPKNCSNSFQALMCLGQKYSINKYIMHSIDNTIVLKVSPINNITNIGQTSAIPNTDLVTWNLDTQTLPLRWWKYLVINLSSTPVSRNRRILNKKTHTHINSSPPGQIGHHFADDIFICMFENEKICILIEISLKFIPKDPIDNKPALV